MDKVCIKVDPGICGFSCRVQAWRKEKRVAGLEISGSQCEMIHELSTLLDEITIKNLFLPLTSNPIFLSAEQAGCHLACPVPVAIVKSVEAALGLSIPKDVAIQFKNMDYPFTIDNNNKKTVPKLEAVEERVATGKAKVLLEIICERVHCVMYDYAINTVDMVAETFGEQIEIQTIIRRGSKENAERFMELSKKAGKLLSVPTILINGDVLFTTVPLPDELTAAISSYLKIK